MFSEDIYRSSSWGDTRRVWDTCLGDSGISSILSEKFMTVDFLRHSMLREFHCEGQQQG